MDFFDKYKKIIFILVTTFCILAVIVTVERTNPSMIENSLGFILTPIQKLNTNAAGWIKSKFNIITNLNEIENENIELKKQAEDNKIALSRLEQIENENKKLSELLNIDIKYSSYPKIGARIIAKDPGNWYDIFTIDKGSKDGFKKNMVVISSGGLVGRIKETGYNYSKVVSIIDDSDAVSAKSLRTDDIGFVRGDLSNKGYCKMEYIDKDAEIVEGDEIVTSNLSDIYPPGITIGYVKEINTDSNTLTKYAVIEPTVDFKHLETILVITQTFEKNLVEQETQQEETEITETEVTTEDMED